ncbi:hypothetical protein [Rhodohalobacter sp.]|uniref:hypothetical protein n=1 Tax=Rhodohalobacter sp. TaxID=1974210 RepID=UPI002ACD5475|nr:hypothetical protein [Rhodohalobacter sp.]MDZ7756171.1 hypothetical protein [Rhodohalobacter sp.]
MKQDEAEEVLSAVCNVFSPFAVMHVDRKTKPQSISEMAGYTSTQQKKERRITLYVCEEL